LQYTSARGSRRNSQGKSSGTSSRKAGSGIRWSIGGGTGDTAAATCTSTLRPFDPPSLFGRLALHGPRWPFGHVPQSMQMDPHRLNARLVASDTLQVCRRQPSGPHRAGYLDRVWVQVDHPPSGQAWCWRRVQRMMQTVKTGRPVEAVHECGCGPCRRG
jgi:hypothetical protein